MIIEVRNIQKSFGNLPVLKGIDLDVDNGEIVSIVGKSGAGKTTFAHQIFGPPHNDTVLVDVDEYYKKINGDECDRSNSYKVWMAVYDKIHECEINNQDVALVTNALTVANREEFVEWFPTFNHKMIFFLADLKDCKKYNAQRNRVIPEHLMDKI